MSTFLIKNWSFCNKNCFSQFFQCPQHCLIFMNMSNTGMFLHLEQLPNALMLLFVKNTTPLKFKFDKKNWSVWVACVTFIYVLQYKTGWLGTLPNFMPLVSFNTSENIKKRLVFCCFQVLKKGTHNMKWVKHYKASLRKNIIYSWTEAAAKMKKDCR